MKIKTVFSWIKTVKEMNFWILILSLLGIYLILNLLFSIIYCCCGVLGEKDFLDYFYFSNVTSFTVGFGDMTPITKLGKVLVIIQMAGSSILFAFFIAILTTKLFYPKNTIKFSKKIFINEKDSCIGFRVLNIHSEPLINPEIRIHYTEHCVGNTIARISQLGKSSQLGFLGKHDFSHVVQVAPLFIDNLKEAIQFDSARKENELKSRFRVIVTISGNNGIQEIAQMYRYYPKDFKAGKSFKPIQYDMKDQKKRVNYSNFGNFEHDFECII